jgi:hypothetical protein
MFLLTPIAMLVTLALCLLALALGGCAKEPPPPPLPAHVRVVGNDFVVTRGYEGLGWSLCGRWEDGSQPFDFRPLPDGTLIQCQNGDNSFRYTNARRYVP